MVLSYHLIWTLYGWWLPNDPRGSMSKFIASDVIAELGELHFGRKRVQPSSRELRAFLAQSESVLKHERKEFLLSEFPIVASLFSAAIAACGYTCYACAIMPDHVHLVIRKHRDSAEQMIARFQDMSRQGCIDRGLRPNGHPVWGGPGWKVFLDSPEDIRRTIHYVERNPAKIGLPQQNWDFVTKYDGWPFHKRRAY